MRAVEITPLLPLGVLCAAALCFTGCQAERAVVAPAEPTWSYHDGSEQLSNNDLWEQLIPTSTAELVFNEASVASVEESTE